MRDHPHCHSGSGRGRGGGPDQGTDFYPPDRDIHFNYKYALACAERGIDAIRINPGNIGGEEKVKAVADICRQKSIPIRIGVNGGSLEKDLRAKYGGVTAEALVESAMGTWPF